MQANGTKRKLRRNKEIVSFLLRKEDDSTGKAAEKNKLFAFQAHYICI
jgi:hypothetical protein